MFVITIGDLTSLSTIFPKYIFLSSILEQKTNFQADTADCGPESVMGIGAVLCAFKRPTRPISGHIENSDVDSKSLHRTIVLSNSK